MADQFLYGQAGTLYFPVYVAGGTRFATNGDWTPGGTNTTVMQNGTLKGFGVSTVSYVGSAMWALPLGAAELTAKRVLVLVSEPGTIDDQMLAVDTVQNDSAHWPVVLGSVGTVSLAQKVNTGTLDLAVKVNTGTLDYLVAGTVGLAVKVNTGTLDYLVLGSRVQSGTVDLAAFLNGGTVDLTALANAVNGTLNLYEAKVRPAYNVNDDKLVAAGWVEKDGLAQNATSATFNLYTYDGTLVFGSSAWDKGPTEVAALNSWFVEKNTATAIKGGTVYFLHGQFDVGGVIYTRIEAFGAYGTGTGA